MKHQHNTLTDSNMHQDFISKLSWYNDTNTTNNRNTNTLNTLNNKTMSGDAENCSTDT